MVDEINYYAVASGDIFRCVQAATAMEACVTAAQIHMEDDFEESCQPGQIFQVAQLGKSSGDDLFILSERVLEEGGFTVTDSLAD